MEEKSFAWFSSKLADFSVTLLAAKYFSSSPLLSGCLLLNAQQIARDMLLIVINTGENGRKYVVVITE